MIKDIKLYSRDILSILINIGYMTVKLFSCCVNFNVEKPRKKSLDNPKYFLEFWNMQGFLLWFYIFLKQDCCFFRALFSKNYLLILNNCAILQKEICNNNPYTYIGMLQSNSNNIINIILQKNQRAP